MKEDIEIIGFLTSIIAWGKRSQIIQNALQLADMMDGKPFDFVMNFSDLKAQKMMNFVHRTFNGMDCIYFLHSLKNIYINHSGLESVFTEGYRQDSTIKSAIANFRKIFFEIETPGRTSKHIANVDKGSAAKRLNMFLRWMVRSDEAKVDFGLWKGISMKDLMIPLDLHTAKIARKLGILLRKQNDWKAVEELTGVLREFDPADPIKYDYALFGLGIFEYNSNV